MSKAYLEGRRYTDKVEENSKVKNIIVKQREEDELQV